MADNEVVQKTLTGFMREEVKRMKAENQGGGKDYNSQGTIISEDQEVNHGGYEENESGAGAGGGLPARLPTEMMDVPPDENPNPTDDEEEEEEEAQPEQYEQPQAAAAAQDATEDQQEQQLIEPEEQQQQEIGTGLTAEFAALDEEMAEQFYYLNENGHKCGPFTVQEVTQKYKSEEISDETRIWDGTQTKADATALKENKRIYSNLPRPPKRQQPAQQQQAEPVQQKQPEPAPATTAQQGKTQNVPDTQTNAPPQNSGGCCCVVL